MDNGRTLSPLIKVVSLCERIKDHVRAQTSREWRPLRVHNATRPWRKPSVEMAVCRSTPEVPLRYF